MAGKVLAYVYDEDGTLLPVAAIYDKDGNDISETYAKRTDAGGISLSFNDDGYIVVKTS